MKLRSVRVDAAVIPLQWDPMLNGAACLPARRYRGLGTGMSAFIMMTTITIITRSRGASG